MEIRCHITKVIPLEQGVSKSGSSWRKAQFVAATYDQYPRNIAFILFNDNVDKYSSFLQEGNDLNVSFDIQSRDWIDSRGQTHWSTDVVAWRIEPGAAAQPEQQPQQPQQPQQMQQPQPPSQQPQPPSQQQIYDQRAAQFFGSDQPYPQPAPSFPAGQQAYPTPDDGLPF